MKRKEGKPPGWNRPMFGRIYYLIIKQIQCSLILAKPLQILGGRNAHELKPPIMEHLEGVGCNLWCCDKASHYIYAFGGLELFHIPSKLHDCVVVCTVTLAFHNRGHSVFVNAKDINKTVSGLLLLTYSLETIFNQARVGVNHVTHVLLCACDLYLLAILKLGAREEMNPFDLSIQKFLHAQVTAVEKEPSTLQHHGMT